MDDRSCLDWCALLIEAHHQGAMAIGEHRAAKFVAVTCGHGISRDDLAAEAIVGLVQAAKAYDPTCGVPFRSYAKKRVAGAVADAARRAYPVPRAAWETSQMVLHDETIARPAGDGPSDPVAVSHARDVARHARTALASDPACAESIES